MKARGAQSLLRESNQLAVLAVLREGPASQADVVRATRLSGATVSTIVRGLLDSGVVEAAPGVGRGQALRLATGSGLTAALAFGATGVLVAVADLTGTVLGRREVPLDCSLDRRLTLTGALDALDALLGESSVDRRALVAAGIALPVPLIAGGRAAGHDQGQGVRLVEELADALPCPVHVDNDANLGARAEHRWGELRGVDVGAWVKASTGIGLGLVIGGGVHRGAKGTAGELGHVSTDPRGRLCPCGNRGCLELAAGGPALLRQHEAVTGRTTDLRGLVAAAVAGEAAARRLVEDAGTLIGGALAGLVTLLDPQRVVLAGHLAAAGDLLLDPLVAALRRDSMPAVADGVAVCISSLGDDAVLLGALALALDHARPRAHA